MTAERTCEHDMGVCRCGEGREWHDHVPEHAYAGYCGLRLIETCAVCDGLDVAICTVCNVGIHEWLGKPPGPHGHHPYRARLTCTDGHVTEDGTMTDNLTEWRHPNDVTAVYTLTERDTNRLIARVSGSERVRLGGC